MIFKHLFTPKYKHPNETIRVKAIDALSLEDPKQKSQLHELAFNDASQHIRYKALQKLDNFSLWWKVAQTEKDEFVHRKAVEIVEQTLLQDKQSSLNDDQKTFLVESSNRSLLEKVLKERLLQSDDVGLISQLLKKLAKPQLNRQFLLARQDTPLAVEILNDVTDESELAKLLKKITHEPLQQQVAAKLTALKEEKEKPLRIEKNVKLILAKLLVLKDSKYYGELRQQKDMLMANYISLQSDFDCLDVELSQEFEDKYHSISKKLDIVEQSLSASWQADQHHQEQLEILTQAKEQVEQLVDDIASRINQDIDHFTLAQLEAFKERHNQLQDQLDSIDRQALSNQSVKVLESVLNQLNGSQGSLDRLPHFQQAILQAAQKLEEYQKLDVPTGLESIDVIHKSIKTMKNEWRELKGAFSDNWPRDLEKRFTNLVTSWKKSASHFEQQRKDLLKRCRSKLNYVDKLIGEGKFHKAMGVYQSTIGLYSDLDDSLQGQLSRQFNKVKEQIEHLQEWQEYLASPRRPELMKQIQQLVNQPLDIDEQAKQVKLLREQWNSLGRLEKDDPLEIEFNQLLETAFAPCREHFAQMQQLREQNLARKTDLLEQFAALSAPEIPIEQVASSYRDLMKAWKEVGEVDYKTLDRLNNQFQRCVTPLKARINEYHQENAEAKRRLIEKAKGLNIEEIEGAVDQAKQLQEKWKQIGFAGTQHDKQLWQLFREANDLIFAARNEQLQKAKEDKQNLFSQLDSCLVEMDEVLRRSEDKGTLNKDFDTLIDAYKEQIENLGDRDKGRWIKGMEQRINNKAKKIKDWSELEKKQVFASLFAALEQWQEEERDISEHLAALPAQWRECFNLDGRTDESQDLRHALTIKIELVEQVESPHEDLSLRKEIQLSLMVDKLSGEEQLDKMALLKAWIRLGPLSNTDKGLLSRIRHLYM